MLVLALAVALIAPVNGFAPGVAPLRGAYPPGERFGESGRSKAAGVVVLRALYPWYGVDCSRAYGVSKGTLCSVLDFCPRVLLIVACRAWQARGTPPVVAAQHLAALFWGEEEAHFS